MLLVGTIMLLSIVGLAVLLWTELTDPERLEPQPRRSSRTCCLERPSQVSDLPLFLLHSSDR